MRRVVVYPGEDGHWVAECPSLSPCVSQGRAKAEAIANIKEAIGLYLEVLANEGRTAPEDQAEMVAVEVQGQGPKPGVTAVVARGSRARTVGACCRTGPGHARGPGSLPLSG